MKTVAFLVFFLYLSTACIAQGPAQHVLDARGDQGLRVVFYNVENLFDIEDDSLTQDEEFLPTGQRGWNWSRYQTKLNHIYQTLSALGGWELPDIIGVCEIENRRVLEDLVNRTPLRKLGYQVIHEDSPDARGIDVGLIVKTSKVKYLSHRAIAVNFPDDAYKTRDILMAELLVLNSDTLRVFVNHWPSRRGGKDDSEPRRMFVAGLARAAVDSLLQVNPNANILLMGDYNDEPENASLVEVLRAHGPKDNLAKGDLVNLMRPLLKNWKFGSHKFQEHWGVLDQIIVSQALLNGKLQVAPQGAVIFDGDFLLTEDLTHFGQTPFRTYNGPAYIGGYSDHLPVYVDLIKK